MDLTAHRNKYLCFAVPQRVIATPKPKEESSTPEKIQREEMPIAETKMETPDFTPVAKMPPPGFAFPTSCRFDPKSSMVSFLAPSSAEAGTARHLFHMNLKSKAIELLVHPPNEGDTEQNLSLEEKLRRERQRLMTTGVSSYSWSAEGSIMVPLNGCIYLQRGQGAPLELLYNKEEAAGISRREELAMTILEQAREAEQRDYDRASIKPSEADRRRALEKYEDHYARNMARYEAARIDGCKEGSVALDPTLSPDGRMVAFVQDSEVYVVDVDRAAGGRAPQPFVQVTSGARGTGKTHGVADYVAQEEMDRYSGFWWSWDSTHIAFEVVDESHIPQYRIMHQGNDMVGEGAQEDHRYPFAGEANPKVGLGVVNVEDPSQPTVWLDLVAPLMEHGNYTKEQAEDLYLARVNWMPDGSLVAQVENREQSELYIIRYNLRTGNTHLVLKETSKVWINLHDMFVPVTWDGSSAPDSVKHLANDEPNSFFFLWASERDGFRHLYLYHFSESDLNDSADGCARLIHRITEGEWMTEKIVAIDTANSLVYYTGTRDSPLECHVYASSLAEPSSGVLRLTPPGGFNDAAIDREFKHAVITRRSIHHPPCVFLADMLSAKEIRAKLSKDASAPVPSGADVAHPEKLPQVLPIAQWIHEPWGSDKQVAKLKSLLVPPTLVSFNVFTNTGKDTSAFPPDGANVPHVKLYGAVYKPDPAVHGPGPYPTVINVYGGPHAQRVQDNWSVTADLRSQTLASRGYLVFRLDNRGAARRGLEFEGFIKHCMGTVEIDDQVSGINWLVQQKLADKNRIAINGWSYGGYMSAICLVKRPDVFHVAVSGAPVTHWDGYDTHYTERYMGTPKSNPAGYHDGAVMTHVAGLEGKLLLVHGLIDENVHFRHTARLINALIAKRKKYDLLLFPNERHSPRSLQDRLYMEEQIFDYFEQHLKNRVV